MMTRPVLDVAAPGRQSFVPEKNTCRKCRRQTSEETQTCKRAMEASKSLDHDCL